MTTIITRPILVKSGDFEHEGLLHLKFFDARERKIRAAKIWGLMWLGAVLSIPIIIVHFILVPGFLIAGPVMAMKRLRTAEIPDHASGTCPANKEEFQLPLEPSTKLPLWTHCPQCRCSLHLRNVEPVKEPVPA